MAKPYHTVSLDEEPFLPKAESFDEKKLTWKTGGESVLARFEKLAPHWIWLGHALLLSVSLTFFGLSFCQKTEKISDLEYTKQFSAWSPAASAVKYETQHFDLPPKAEGPFIGKGDDVDARWDYITAVGDTMISREEMMDLGVDPDAALAITDPRNGEPGYRVALEVFHQLHCLNLLRQHIYRDHYAPMGGDTAAPEDKLHAHLDHCIDALRQSVMCQGDVGVFSFNYPFGDGDPWPDYSTPHTCRNFESIRQWAVDHTVPRGPDEPEH